MSDDNVIPLRPRLGPREQARAAHPSSSGRRRAGAARAAPPPSSPTGRSSRPEPRRLVELVARVFLEVEAGRRPFTQLAPLLSPALRVRLEGRVPDLGQAAAPAAAPIVAVHCEQPRPQIVNAAVVVRRGGRVASLVVRIERHRGAWRVTELARPEDTMRPAPPRPPWLSAPDDAAGTLAGCTGADDVDEGDGTELAGEEAVSADREEPAGAHAP